LVLHTKEKFSDFEGLENVFNSRNGHTEQAVRMVQTPTLGDKYCDLQGCGGHTPPTHPNSSPDTPGGPRKGPREPSRHRNDPAILSNPMSQPSTPSDIAISTPAGCARGSHCRGPSDTPQGAAAAALGKRCHGHPEGFVPALGNLGQRSEGNIAMASWGGHGGRIGVVLCGVTAAWIPNASAT
jgi:hypothetical protein